MRQANPFNKKYIIKRKFQKQSRKQRLSVFALRLNKNLPKSEKWFADLYLEFKHKDDRTNVPFAGLIPDLKNKSKKYIIEVDGSIHEKEFQKKIDIEKDKKYTRLGYKVFRIKAFDEDSFKTQITALCRYRSQV